MLTPAKLRAAASALEQGGAWKPRERMNGVLLRLHDHDVMTPFASAELAAFLYRAAQHSEGKTPTALAVDMRESWWSVHVEGLCDLILSAHEGG